MVKSLQSLTTLAIIHSAAFTALVVALMTLAQQMATASAAVAICIVEAAQIPPGMQRSAALCAEMVSLSFAC